jgi:hypothetical protein
MYLLGHTDPKFTMRVYQHVLNMGGSAPNELEKVLGCTCDEAFTILTGRDIRGLIEDPHEIMVRNSRDASSGWEQKTPQMLGFSESG